MERIASMCVTAPPMKHAITREDVLVSWLLLTINNSLFSCERSNPYETVLGRISEKMNF